jgi:hypothetical protein
MARKPTAVRQVDLTRALEAAEKAGMKVARVEIDMVGGRIAIITAGAAVQQPASAYDEWVARDARPT